jgi:sarcosine oxidase subunit beta
MNNQKYDAIIIGTGIIGTCIAFELTKKGFKTLSLDKLGGAGMGSTAGSCAIIRTSYSTRDGVALAYENIFYWDKWDEYLEVKDPEGNVVFHKTGSLMMKSPDGHWQKVLGHYDSLGIPYQSWDEKKTLERLPIANFKSYHPVTRPEEDEGFFEPKADSLEGAVFTPNGGYISDPKHSCHNVMIAAKAKGAEFKFNAEVTRIRKANGKVLGVTLKDGNQIDAPVVVNVAGPHSFVINQMAGIENNIKTRALRHEVAFAPSPKGYDYERDGLHVSDGDCGVYFRPETGNALLIGSEDPACDPRDWIDDPDEFNRSVTVPQWEAQVLRCARRINDLQIPNEKRGVVELYDVADDWIPIYDKSDLGGFYQAIGTSGNQYKNGPVVGMIMAELIHQVEKQGLDHDKKPLRFKLENCGVTINIGTFSRNREINPNSSFSVNG